MEAAEVEGERRRGLEDHACCFREGELAGEGGEGGGGVAEAVEEDEDVCWWVGGGWWGYCEGEVRGEGCGGGESAGHWSSKSDEWLWALTKV